MVDSIDSLYSTTNGSTGALGDPKGASKKGILSEGGDRTCSTVSNAPSFYSRPIPYCTSVNAEVPSDFPKFLNSLKEACSSPNFLRNKSVSPDLKDSVISCLSEALPLPSLDEEKSAYRRRLRCPKAEFAFEFLQMFLKGQMELKDETYRFKYKSSAETLIAVFFKGFAEGAVYSSESSQESREGFSKSIKQLIGWDYPELPDSKPKLKPATVPPGSTVGSEESPARKAITATSNL